MNFINDIKLAFNNANIVEKIIYINVLLFLFTAIFSSFFIEYFALPTTFNNFISKPWTLISYAFIHQRIFHILSNLLVLYYIGNLFLNFHTQKQFLNFYFLGIIAGALTFLSYYYLTNKLGAPLGGASAAVSTIFIAMATKTPRYSLQLRFIGSVELWVLAAIWVSLSILQLANPNNGSAIAHLAGALFGFIYANQLIKGNDIGKWFENLIDFFSQIFKSKKDTKLKTVHRSKNKSISKNVIQSKQRKIDAILDKIGKSGYDSLTKEEKDFLFRAGKK